MSAATAPEGQPSNTTWGRPYALLMNACGAVAALTFGLMSLLVCADVVLRNLGYDALSTSVEVTEYMLIIATFVAAPWVPGRSYPYRRAVQQSAHVCPALAGPDLQPAGSGGLWCVGLAMCRRRSGCSRARSHGI